MPARVNRLLPPDFGMALRHVRRSRSLSQDQLGAVVTGRSYLGELERGLKQPTIGTLHELSEQLRVHPLTLLALAYTQGCSVAEVEMLALTMLDDLRSLAGDAT